LKQVRGQLCGCGSDGSVRVQSKVTPLRTPAWPQRKRSGGWSFPGSHWWMHQSTNQRAIWPFPPDRRSSPARRASWRGRIHVRNVAAKRTSLDASAGWAAWEQRRGDGRSGKERVRCGAVPGDRSLSPTYVLFDGPFPVQRRSLDTARFNQRRRSIGPATATGQLKGKQGRYDDE